MRVCRYPVAAALVLLLQAGVAAQETAPPVVHTALDRTAVWVADRVAYTVEIVCPKGVDILADDLAKEKLKMTGLEVVGFDAVDTTAADESTTHRFRYVVTTYRVDTPTLRIEPLSVRYFVKRPGQRLQDEAPAGEFMVPGASIAYRSMIPDNADAALRDGRPAAARAERFTMAGSVGAALILVSIAPLAFVAAGLLRRRHPRREGKSARRIRQEEKVSLEALDAIDLTSAEGRRRAYDGIDALVRAHLRDACSVPGPAMTPAEVTATLDGQRLRVAPESVAALLAECERARYAPEALLPGTDACRDALAQARQVVAAR
jgi:hypothetical protein